MLRRVPLSETAKDWAITSDPRRMNLARRTHGVTIGIVDQVPGSRPTNPRGKSNPDLESEARLRE